MLFSKCALSVQALASLIALSSFAMAVDAPAEQWPRPNIVFILADDLGFSDIEPYGSEVRTPTLSALADTGIRFTNFHTAANCAPARAMLLTGVSSHLAGVPNIPEMLAPEQRMQDNYQGVLASNVVTVATLLEDAGYHACMAGIREPRTRVRSGARTRLVLRAPKTVRATLWKLMPAKRARVRLRFINSRRTHPL